MELKYARVAQANLQTVGSNRTFMELKYCKTLFITTRKCKF